MTEDMTDAKPYSAEQVEAVRVIYQLDLAEFGVTHERTHMQSVRRLLATLAAKQAELSVKSHILKGQAGRIHVLEANLAAAEALLGECRFNDWGDLDTNKATCARIDTLLAAIAAMRSAT